MALLKRELYRQVKGPEITHADRCALVWRLLRTLFKENSDTDEVIE